MLIKRPADIKQSEITDRSIYESRRVFLKTAATMFAGSGGLLFTHPGEAGAKLQYKKQVRRPGNEPLTSKKYSTSYNNFYEFGTGKGDPAKYAQGLKTHPWKIKVSGEIRRPAMYDFDDLIKPHTLVERVYRLRCVEAWSMVIPWVGIPLRDIIKRLQPTSRAKYVAFETLYDPKQMPGQRPGLFGSGLQWPYVEGLRLDEAMHPLTLLAVGLYGEILPNQNGAPVRLIVPWKYGFKSIKSIVGISFTETQPITTWSRGTPREYGFYANVNPNVDHPRWSQARERRISSGSLFESLLTPKHKTRMFNGYADQVAGLYRGMDLNKFF